MPPDERPSEQQLIDASLHGDRSAFGALLEHHLPRLFTLLLRLTGDRQAAEDLTQEAALRAFERLPSFQGTARFSTWLYRVAVNLGLRHLEREAPLSFERWPPIPDGPDEPAASGLGPEERHLIGQVREGCLTGLVRCLPREQRLAFVLEVLLGLPLVEVAAILDCSVGAAKTRVSRARAALADFVERRCQWIDARNRCRCQRFVRYALDRGLITAPPGSFTAPALDLEAVEEDVDRLRRVVNLYAGLPPPGGPPTLVERVRQGLVSSEWPALD
jgi:RNA polymerase sigma factor (sigma-70 family)